MQYSTLFFDLDDTLYSHQTGLWEAVRARMSDYMLERLKIPAQLVPQLRREYYETYGTTLRGLQYHYQVDVDDYLAYVHDLPLEKYLQPDPKLRAILLSLPQPRWIFTNADDEHARRVLRALHLIGCFEGVVDLRAMGFACKPELQAYQRALAIAGETDPRKCVLLDDAERNLAPARQLGFTVVRVGSPANGSHAALWLPSLLDLPQVMPELWNGA